MLFETERLLVRRFTLADTEAFFLLNSNEQVMRFIRPPKNREECDAFLAENINLYKDGSCIGRYAAVEKDTGNIAGTFSFLYFSGEADFHLGYALLPSEWGKGFATELTKQGVLYFFANTTRLEVFAITVPENVASQTVLLKSGFERKGRKEENGKEIELFSIGRKNSIPV